MILDVVHDRGADNVQIEDIIQEVAPRATSLVTDDIRKTMVKDIRKFLKESSEDY